MKKRPYLAAPAAALGMLVLILDSRTALNGASDGISLCVKTIVPSLFPFIFLSGTFAAHCPRAGRFACFLSKPFGIPQGAEALLVPALLGGYPVGAQCVYESHRTGITSIHQAQRMLAYCSNVGPAFLFGILPAFFAQSTTVWSIWAIQIFSILSAAFLFSTSYPASKTAAAPASFGIEQAIWAMLKICGWVILFRVVIGFCRRWFLWMRSPLVQVLIMGTLELSNGCCMLNLIADEKIRFVVCNVLLAFGGLCVLYQTASVCPGLSMRFYLCGKLIQATAAAISAAALAFRLWILIPIWALLLFSVKASEKAVEIRKNMVYNECKDKWRAGYAVSQKN